MTNKNFLVTYYQTLMEVFDPWGSKNLKIDYKCQKIEKKMVMLKSCKTFHYI